MRRVVTPYGHLDTVLLAAVLCLALVFTVKTSAALPQEVQNLVQAASEAEQQATANRFQNNITEARRLEFQARNYRLEAVRILEDTGVNYREADSTFETLLDTLESLGYHDLAAEHLDTAVQHQQENIGLWLRLGQNRYAMGPAGHDAAFTALMKADSLRSDENLVLSNALQSDIDYALARLYYDKGLYNFALERVEAALVLDEAHLASQVLMSALEARDGKILEASNRLEVLGRALQPLDAQTRILLRESLAHFDQTRGAFPDTAEHHFAYSRLLYRAARIHEAVLALQRCTVLRPDDIETWNFLAAIHLQLGNYPAARHAYEQSLEIQADQPAIQSSYEQLKAFLEEMEAQQQNAETPSVPESGTAPIPLR